MDYYLLVSNADKDLGLLDQFYLFTLRHSINKPDFWWRWLLG